VLFYSKIKSNLRITKLIYGVKLIPITANENIIPKRIEKNILIASEKLNETILRGSK
jgi:hypothetical protein